MAETSDSASFLSTDGSAKLGLALSGGGFRAALFHIGILAQLAERDLLRQVEVISTVSGGSIIGAFYYLKVKRLLEGRRSDELRPDADGYRVLIEEVEREFLAAVQKNMRISALSDRSKNARMMGDKYSTTQRLAELYDEYFFKPLNDGDRTVLQDLPIELVAGMLDDPGLDATRVPTLVLNATILNTGRLWQFTGSFVGESESAHLVAGASPMPVIGRVSLRDPALTPRQRARLNRLTLGEAVAASCCVPGLLEPFRLSGVYRDDQGSEIDVRLVDGGVCDNQGLVSLFDADCTHFLCSDATDLLKLQVEGPQRTVEVVTRANEIMMDRIRVELLTEVFNRDKGSYALFHLGDEAGGAVFPDDSKRFITALANIRTDLDSFSDMEALSLMYFGHGISGEKLNQALLEKGGSSGAETVPGNWQFMAIKDQLMDPQVREDLLQHLEVGSRQLFKVFYMGKWLPFVIVLAPLTIPVALSGIIFYLMPPLPIWVWVVLGVLLLSTLVYTQNSKIIQWLDQIPAFRKGRRRMEQIMRPLGVPTVFGAIGAMAAWIQLRIFDRLFLKYGRLVQASEKHRLLRRKKPLETLSGSGPTS